MPQNLVYPSFMTQSVLRFFLQQPSKQIHDSRRQLHTLCKFDLSVEDMMFGLLLCVFGMVEWWGTQKYLK